MDNTFDKAAWAAKKQAARQDAYDMIEQYLDNMSLEEESIRQYLTVQGRFPQCSVGNAILIAAQKPEATCYKTYAEWSKENIFILRGETGFSMLVPNGTYTGKDGKTHTNFDVQKVFDISQTNAPPKADVPDVRQSLQALLMRPVCPVQVVDQQKGAVYVAAENRVEIGRGLSVEESFRTITMALAHGELAKTIPDYKPGAPQNSFYARCISYVVCVRYGVEPKTYHFQDLPQALGNCNNRELRQHLTVIHTAALTMIDRTDKAKQAILARQPEEREAR